MADNGSSAGTVLVAFALGAMAGAAIALLYAPGPGEETRRRISEKAREGRQKAEKLARDGREFLDRQRETISNAVERGREAVERGREAFEQARKESL